MLISVRLRTYVSLITPLFLYFIVSSRHEKDTEQEQIASLGESLW